jgi:hypothetical protein
MMQTERTDVMLKVLNTLDEAQTRWFVAREAMMRGRGGIAEVCRLTKVSKPTVIKGMKELMTQSELGLGDRVRHTGGGRKRLEERDPGVARALQAIMAETTAGDPMSLLKWTSKSTYRIRDELIGLGHAISEDTVRRRLKAMDYSLQANEKANEGESHPDRDRQFRYINRLARAFVKRGEPVLSVDAKKKERIGEFKNAGRRWRRKGSRPKVNVYDFPSLAQGTAIPYGTYDIQENRGMVNVGMTHETAEFAVESIRRWWRQLGKRRYPQARALLICADGGGGNGSRSRAWKFYLQGLADELGLAITVCHYPPGASKWNKIEHRMFSFISINWRGEPLVSFETVINLISATRTKAGLNIKAMLDPNDYQTGVKISDQQMQELQIKPHKLLGEWNYTIAPRPS